MSGGDEDRSSLQSPSWRLDPIIERRLSMTSAELDKLEAAEAAGKEQPQREETSPVSGLLSPQDEPPSSSSLDKGQQTESAAGSSSGANLQRAGSQGGSARFVMYSNEMKARALSYSNIPDLGEDFGSASSFGASLTQQQSFSSLNLPGGHVGSMPHSRRETPADGKWMQSLDLSRLFGGIGAYTRDKADTIDETLGDITTPSRLDGRGGRRGGAGGGHRRSRSRRETPHSSKTKEPLLKSRVLDDDDDDDDDDPDHSFRQALAGIDSKMSPLSSLSPDLDSMREQSWFARLWQKLYFGKGSNDMYNDVLKGGNYESDYLALVPLSDPRLNKRWPLWAFILFMVLISFTVFSGVFFFVQRQVLVNQGEIVTTTSAIHINPRKPGDIHGNYTLDLEIDIPVHNQNYFPATIKGGIGIFLFSYKGGEVSLDDTVEARSTKIFTLAANASHFDSTVTTTIIGRCTSYKPNKLQFVLQGEISTRVLFYGTQTTLINTYAIVDCKPSG